MSDHIGGASKLVGDTPRTDAWRWDKNGHDTPMEAFSKFAEGLERELNQANERVKFLEVLLTGERHPTPARYGKWISFGEWQAKNLQSDGS